MSQLNFPRFNFSGTVTINVGTGNNDDYSSAVRVSDSINVEPLMNGNTTDQQFMDWATNIQTFPPQNPKGQPQEIIPGEWNFFGDMGFNLNEDVTIQGIQIDEETLITSPDQSPIIGTQFSMYPAIIIDVNPEGVSSSQIFCDNVSLKKGDTTYFSGTPTKASARFINFTRNIDLNASTGASASFFCVIPVENIDPSSPLLNDANVKNLGNMKGFMVRYNVYRSITELTNNAAIQKLYENYENKQLNEMLNPKVAVITGTFSPWFEGQLESVTAGRYLVPKDSFPNPNFPKSGNGPNFYLAPVICGMDYGTQFISLDVLNSFPNNYNAASNEVGMLDIGNVTLNFNLSGEKFTIGTINYNNYQDFTQRGGIIDLTLPDNVRSNLDAGTFEIVSDKYPGKTLMAESDYLVTTDQYQVYTNQGDPVGKYICRGVPEPIVLNAYYRGNPVTADNAATFTAYEYAMTPNNDQQYTGYSESVSFPSSDGSPVTLPLRSKDRGNFMYLILPEGVEKPSAPQSLNLLAGFYVNLRVLPTNDYSQYINNPDTLTWEVIYNNVLRYYRLIFPAMNMVFPFEESYWSNSAAMITERIGTDWWNKVEFMPRTRDLSESRRQLLLAWLKKYMPRV